MSIHPPKKFPSILERFLFSSRWLLGILYMGLSIAMGLYTIKFAIELYEMARNIMNSTTEMAMLSLLNLVDITMVANLVVMVILGGYSIFIKEINPDSFENRPRFMKNITSSGLKIKLASSLVGVSSIHLLKKFIESASDAGITNQMYWNSLSKVIALHLVFVVSMIALWIVDKHHHTPASEETEGTKHA
jgi:uncharacterized protein (TIGR00645 family)